MVIDKYHFQSLGMAIDEHSLHSVGLLRQGVLYVPKVMKVAKQQPKPEPNDKLKRKRLDEKAWTMEDLADEARVSAQTVRKAEQGKIISEVSKARIAKALGTTAAELFS